MTGSRPLLLMLAGVLAIGLALFVVLSPEGAPSQSSGSDHNENWELPPGNYQFALFENQEGLLRSTEFTVRSGAETEFNWVIPEPK